MSNISSNKLLMYLLQNRADEFFSELEKVSPDDCKQCDYPINELYLYVYAIKILLDENDWSEEFKPIIETARTENLRIWNFFLENGLVPNNYHEELINTGRCHSEDDSYEDLLFEPLENLLKWGARKIDCDLYLAVAKLDFDMAKVLLQQGANPDAAIYIEDPSLYEYPEICSCIEEISTWWIDAYEPIGKLNITWENGYNKIDQGISDSDFIQILCAAPYKLMYELLFNYKK